MNGMFSKIEYKIDDDVLLRFKESIESKEEESIIESMIDVLLEVSDNLVDEVVEKLNDCDGDKWNDLSEGLLIKMNLDRR